MKGKKVVTGLVLAVLLIVLLTGAFTVGYLNLVPEDVETVEAKDITMFSAYTECEAFQDVPAMVTSNGKIYDAEDYGSGNYLINVDGSTEEEYLEYLKALELAGFQKHSDNGEDAMEGYAYTASYTKDNLVVTVSHAIRSEHTYISASFDLLLSDHLIYKDEYVAGVSPDAKTKLHMVQLNSLGSSFIIQLKNGHFIVEDGGQKYDAPYFLDYLESLTPEGEKPVIEAWFISHSHADHSGAINEISKNMSDIDRVYVEGIYFTEPSRALFDLLGEGESQSFILMRLDRVFKTTSGEATKIYRPQFGQRYYFCDMAIDVTITLEQFPIGSYYGKDFNDTSTWLMHHIEGQRFLCAGDSSHTGQLAVMKIFDESYFDMDMFAVLHHGINVYKYFINFCTIKTLLYTNFRASSLWEPDTTTVHAHLEENELMRSKAEESLHHGNGTVVLTFPYTVGSAEIMKPFEWKYNGGLQRTEFK